MDIIQERMNGYFVKHHLQGLSRPLVLHEFEAGNFQPDPFPHDHPFGAHIEVIDGAYTEEVYNLAFPEMPPQRFVRARGDRFYNPADKVHRIVELHGGSVVTLFAPKPHEKTSGEYLFRDGRVYHRFWMEAREKPDTFYPWPRNGFEGEVRL